jgi:hypothetical protein
MEVFGETAHVTEERTLGLMHVVVGLNDARQRGFASDAQSRLRPVSENCAAAASLPVG